MSTFATAILYPDDTTIDLRAHRSHDQAEATKMSEDLGPTLIPQLWQQHPLARMLLLTVEGPMYMGADTLFQMDVTALAEDEMTARWARGSESGDGG